jgi:aerobic-type carbon monoxide dehydrogenase small subunit (CoxS/CutS family)
MNIAFILNGEDVSIKSDPMEPLSDILRNHFSITSVLSDCGAGTCGKCVVFWNGRLVNSCLVPAFRVRGSEVISYEGFRSTDSHATVKKAFDDSDVELCGFCDAAKYMAAGSLLDSRSRPDETTILEVMSSVYCRCTTPSATLRAVHRVLDSGSTGKYGRAR